MKEPVNMILENQLRLLRKEYEFEKQTYLDKTKKQGIEKAISQGKCWYPLSCGRSFYSSMNQLVVEVIRDPIDKEHEFEPGKQVCFFYTDMGEIPHFFPFIGTVHHVEDNSLYIVLTSEIALNQLKLSRTLGVQLYFDETSYQEMFLALDHVITAKNNRLSHLRNVLIGEEKPAFHSGIKSRMPWLNCSQEAAVEKVLCAKDVAIVHGPPGTGKTTTLVEAIYETLQRESQVLVCAQSNAAVDWISEKLIERGIPVLRVGNPLRVTENMLHATYERKFESHPDYPELWSIRKLIRELSSQSRKAHYQNKTITDKLIQLRSRATEIEIKINNAVFSEVRVVSSTLIGASNKILNKQRFTTLFVDEAAQALQAATWNAIQKADRVVFAGDHCQLPPTIKCSEVEKAGLGKSLMQYVAETKPEVVSLLTMQYRMHESIMKFSSEWFYNGALKASPSIQNRTILSLDYPMVWYDTSECSFHENMNKETLSKFNKPEAEMLIGLLKKYMLRLGIERIMEDQIDFGLISPYKAQVNYMRTLLRKDVFFKKIRKSISVDTVDGFQGQERDVILISMVRGNESGEIGFLNDLRRMNVAITRARMKLMIIGDKNTLYKHRFYRKLFEHIEYHGKVYSLNEEQLEDLVS